jgi:hypothetical protein
MANVVTGRDTGLIKELSEAAAVGGATTKLLSLPKGITDLGKPAAAIPYC